MMKVIKEKRRLAKRLARKGEPIKPKKGVNWGPLKRVFLHRMGTYSDNLFLDPPEMVEKPVQKAIPFLDRHSFVKALKKRGFQVLGSGAYSTVLTHPKRRTDRVIKVGRYDSWINYIWWAHKLGFAGTWAPKVYSYKLFNEKTPYDKFYVAVMERLDKTVRELGVRHDFFMAPRLFEAHVEHGNPMAGTLMDLLMPGSRTFMEAMKKDFGNHRSLDLHGGNFMVRSDGQLVLTDPLTWSDRPNFTKRYRYTDFWPKAANDNQPEVRKAA